MAIAKPTTYTEFLDRYIEIYYDRLERFWTQ